MKATMPPAFRRGVKQPRAGKLRMAGKLRRAGKQIPRNSSRVFQTLYLLFGGIIATTMIPPFFLLQAITPSRRTMLLRCETVPLSMPRAGTQATPSRILLCNWEYGRK